MSLLRTMLDRFALHREPDFYVGGQANPYLERWFIKRDAQEEPREDTRGFNVFLHRFRRSDDDPSAPRPSVGELQHSAFRHVP
jgi:hypothetical protein